MDAAQPAIRVVLVDDEALIRAGLALLLAAEPDIEVVGEAGDGRAGIEAVSSRRPDVVVMDVRMPGTDGVAATRILSSAQYKAEHGPPPPVLVLTTFSEDEAVSEALRSGAAGFLLKNSAPQILAEAIRALFRGEGWLDPAVTRTLLRNFTASTDAPPSAAPANPVVPREVLSLTPKEREVLVAMAAGLRNSQIAEQMYLSEATVKSHVHRILMKLGLTDRSQAVAVAFRYGLVKPERD